MIVYTRQLQFDNFPFLLQKQNDEGLVLKYEMHRNQKKCETKMLCRNNQKSVPAKSLTDTRNCTEKAKTKPKFVNLISGDG